MFFYWAIVKACESCTCFSKDLRKYWADSRSRDFIPWCFVDFRDLFTFKFLWPYLEQNYSGFRLVSNDAVFGKFSFCQSLSRFVAPFYDAVFLHWQITRILFQFVPLALMISLYGYIFTLMKRKSRKVAKMSAKSRIASAMQEAHCTGSLQSEIEHDVSSRSEPSPVVQKVKICFFFVGV